MKKDKNYQIIDKPIISIHDIISIIRFYYKFIVVTCLSSILIFFLMYYKTHPRFLSSTKILIEKQSETENIFDLNKNDEKFIDSEIAIIKSRELSKAVVDQLWLSHLGYGKKSVFFGTKQYARRGYDWLRKIKESFIPGFLFREKSSLSINDNAFLSEDLKLKFAVKLQRNLKVTQKRGTKILNLSYQSPSAVESKFIVNSIVEVYKKFDTNWSRNQSNFLIDFLEKQIMVASQKLSEKEIELKDFKKKHELFSLNESSQILVDELSSLSRELDNVTLNLNINKKQIEYLKDLLSKEESNIVKDLSEFDNAKLSALRNEISILEVDYIKSVSLYGEDNQIVNQIKLKINSLKDKLNTELKFYISNNVTGLDPLTYRQDLITNILHLESEIYLLENKKYEFVTLLDNVQTKVNVLPDNQMRYSNLIREQKVLSETYTLMRGKLEEAKINAASISDKIRIVDYAIKPSNPISPILNNYLLLGLLSGLVISGLIIYLKEIFDRTIKTLDYVEKFGHPLLTIIPDMKTDTNDNQRKIILIDEPRSPIAESYRALRTKLLFSKSDSNQSKKVILVSSPGPGEGKTTTIVNLGIAFSNLGNKTILIDADLRKPVIHKIFSGSSKIGLTKYLFSTDQLENYIHNSKIDNLDIICSGPIPPNPSEILGSKKMIETIEYLKKDYDTILIDAPPLLAVTDAYVLMHLINQFIMVVRPGTTLKEGLERSLKDISKLNVNFSGIIFNGANKLNSYGTGYYYSNYYYNNDENG